VEFSWNDKAVIWIATCDKIPLALESNFFDALVEKVKIATSEILTESEPNTPIYAL